MQSYCRQGFAPRAKHVVVSQHTMYWGTWMLSQGRKPCSVYQREPRYRWRHRLGCVVYNPTNGTAHLLFPRRVSISATMRGMLGSDIQYDTDMNHSFQYTKRYISKLYVTSGNPKEMWAWGLWPGVYLQVAFPAHRRDCGALVQTTHTCSRVSCCHTLLPRDRVPQACQGAIPILNYTTLGCWGGGLKASMGE